VTLDLNDSNTVTKVRELTGEPFHEGTDNILWQTEEGTYVVTSWAQAETTAGGVTIDADTAAWHSDENGYPVDFNDVVDGKITFVLGDEPQHELALEKLGFVPAES
jgi:hypothetical protein